MPITQQPLGIKRYLKSEGLKRMARLGCGNRNRERCQNHQHGQSACHNNHPAHVDHAHCH